MLGEIRPRKVEGPRRSLTAMLRVSSLALTLFLMISEPAELLGLMTHQSSTHGGQQWVEGHLIRSESGQVGRLASPTLRRSEGAAPVQPGPEQASQLPSSVRPEQKPNQKLLVTVINENNLAVSSARVILLEGETRIASRGETDYAGRCELADLTPGLYRLRVEKEGFYAVVNNIQIGETERAEVTLNHQQEYVESVNVVYSPPAIDPAQTTSRETLTHRDLINLPYPVTRDIRYALPFIPGVLQDATGQIHVDGSATQQIFDQLDGFDITGPASGLFNLRVNVDALRSIEVQSSRYPAEYGKGSGGVLSLTTGMGDDRYRFSATDVFPSIQNRKGLHVKTWTPRGTFSGPWQRGKAWFLVAPEGEYDMDIVEELPPEADRTSAWRFGNLAKAQVNWKANHILTGSFLTNQFGARHFGLTRFDPMETTVNLHNQAYLLTLKDQSLLSNGVLVEFGLGLSRFHGEERPLGEESYVITPEGTRGNFFATAEARSSRLQGIMNVYFPSVRWRGRHELKLGTDINWVTFDESVERRTLFILREDRTLSRAVSFAGNPSFGRNNAQTSGFAEDRWSLSDRFLVEGGVRFDWDQIVDRPLVSPRLASSLLVGRESETKIVWGVGLYYDASNLEFITRPLTGKRFDFFYGASGQALVRPPVETSFHVNEGGLKEPRFLNWSLGLERKLPASLYLKLGFVEKRGHDGWTYLNPGAAPPGSFGGHFEFRNARRDRFRSLEVTVRRTFKGDHVFLASYTRAAARSNAVLDFSLDNPVFGPQAGGPLPWDAPNRVISWGWLPLRRGFEFAYSLDWRDGYPFGLVNQDQQLVAPPGIRRFPKYFSLNAQFERRLRLLGFQWALRAGLDDLTNRHNPSAVDNNVDSPHFLTFGGLQGRALIARIRFLGRK